MSQHTPARSPICYRLDAGLLIVRDGEPFATLHGVRPYDPVELDDFAWEVVTVLNTAPGLLAALKNAAKILDDDGARDGYSGKESYDDAADAARAAIARAEGGE